MSTAPLDDNSAMEPTTDIGAIWKAAIDRYEETTKVKIESLGAARNIEQILAEIQMNQAKFESHRHDGSGLDKFRAMVKTTLTPIQSLASIVTHATKATFPPAEAIFAAVSYLIGVANTVSARYDKITELFEDLNTYLNQLTIWEQNIPPIPELKVILTEIFASVLDFCRICAKYIKRKRIGTAFRSLVLGEDEELKLVRDRFRRMVQQEKGIVMKAILDGVVQHNLKIATDERKEFLNWLSTIEFYEKQRYTFAKHQKGTGQWFLNNNKFQKWFLNKDNATLWCPGDAGAGKTIIVSTAVNYVEENSQRSKVAIAYIYCDYKDPNTQKEIKLLSSITRQLAEQWEPAIPELSAFRANFVKITKYPTADEWISLIQTISKRFEKTYIFVDALDECEEVNRENFLRSINKLEPFARLFITSREIFDLESKFSNISRINIVANKSDIQAYLEFEIKSNDRLRDLTAQDPNLKSDIIKRLNKNAKGMFLLVHLQMQHLCGLSSVAQVRNSLSSLPTGLPEFYGEAVQRIEKQSENDKKTAKKILSYISCAERPLNVEELRHALSIEPGNTGLDENTFPVTKILFKISAGLIRVDEKSNTISLIHHTLQEYLQKNPDKLLPESEFEFATACLTYLSFEVFRSGPCSDGKALEERLQKYRFLDYACHHWGDHVTRCQVYERMSSLPSFLNDEAKLGSSVQILNIPRYRMKDWYDRFPRQYTPLHVVAYWGMDKILTVFVQEGIDINTQDSYGATALHLAAQNGHIAVVKLLLENGADIDITNNRGETALYWSARNGQKQVVELLLRKGASLTLSDHEGWTSLDWAVIGSYNEVVKVILDQHPWLGSDNGKNKALILAAEAGNDKSVQMLLHVGADINWKDAEGSTALTWAVPEGRKNTVQLLLKHGADINSRDEYGNTPLHWAIAHPEIARILLDEGANINAKNDCGRTPLLWSAQDGQIEALKLLLDYQADVNVQDKYGFTPLHAVALKGHEAMARMLLEKGSDPNLKDKDGWTPLYAAALRQHEGIVQLLIKFIHSGANIVTWGPSWVGDEKKRALQEHMAEKKSEGSTATTGLHWAVGQRRVERVQAILDNGADIEVRGVGGSTPLTYGAWIGEMATVRLLLENGARVNEPEQSGRSALEIASKNGYYDIVQLLVENGANIDANIHGFTALLLAAQQKDYTCIVDYLIQKGADVNVEDYYGRSPLHWVAKHGPVETVEMLVEKQASIHAVDSWGRTPLMWAIEEKQFAVVDMLLKTGARVEWQAKDGSNVLHLAAYGCHVKMVHQLLEKGVNVEARTRNGFTALHIAVFIGCVKVVQKLLEKGVSVEARTRDGFTALHIAVIMDDVKVVQKLLRGGADVKARTQWPGAEYENELEKNDVGEEDYWEDESDDDDWQTESDGSDWQDTNGDNKAKGRFEFDKTHRMALSLSKQLCQLLLEQEVMTGVKFEARNGLTMKQLARTVAVQRLLAKYD